MLGNHAMSRGWWNVAIVVLIAVAALGSTDARAQVSSAPPPTAPVGGSAAGVVTLTVEASCGAGSPSTSIPANGTKTAALCASLRDATNMPVAGRLVTFTAGVGVLGSGEAKSITVATDAQGLASTAYRGAGNAAAIDIVSAAVPSMSLVATEAITLTAAGPAATVPTAPVASSASGVLSLTVQTSCGGGAAPSSVPANGTVIVALCAVLRDARNMPVAGQAVTFSAAVGTLGNDGATTMTATTDPQGLAAVAYRGVGHAAATDVVSAAVPSMSLAATEAITLTAAGPGTVPPTAPVASSASGVLSLTVQTSCGAGAAPSSVPANGTVVVALCAVLRDARNMPVAGQAVTFSATVGTIGNDQAKSVTVATDAQGLASVAYRGAGNVAATDVVGAGVSSMGLAATTAITLTAGDGGGSTSPGTFQQVPAFDAQGQALAVFSGGPTGQLATAARGVQARGVWLQDAAGVYQLLVVDGPDFINDRFEARFPNGLGVASVLLVR